MADYYFEGNVELNYDLEPEERQKGLDAFKALIKKIRGSPNRNSEWEYKVLLQQFGSGKVFIDLLVHCGFEYKHNSQDTLVFDPSKLDDLEDCYEKLQTYVSLYCPTSKENEEKDQKNNHLRNRLCNRLGNRLRDRQSNDDEVELVDATESTEPCIETDSTDTKTDDCDDAFLDVSDAVSPDVLNEFERKTKHEIPLLTFDFNHNYKDEDISSFAIPSSLCEHPLNDIGEDEMITRERERDCNETLEQICRDGIDQLGASLDVHSPNANINITDDQVVTSSKESTKEPVESADLNQRIASQPNDHISDRFIQWTRTNMRFSGHGAQMLKRRRGTKIKFVCKHCVEKKKFARKVQKDLGWSIPQAQCLYDFVSKRIGFKFCANETANAATPFALNAKAPPFVCNLNAETKENAYDDAVTMDPSQPHSIRNMLGLNAIIVDDEDDSAIPPFYDASPHTPNEITISNVPLNTKDPLPAAKLDTVLSKISESAIDSSGNNESGYDALSWVQLDELDIPSTPPSSDDDEGIGAYQWIPKANIADDKALTTWRDREPSQTTEERIENAHGSEPITLQLNVDEERKLNDSACRPYRKDSPPYLTNLSNGYISDESVSNICEVYKERDRNKPKNQTNCTHVTHLRECTNNGRKKHSGKGLLVIRGAPGSYKPVSFAQRIATRNENTVVFGAGDDIIRSLTAFGEEVQRQENGIIILVHGYPNNGMYGPFIQIWTERNGWDKLRMIDMIHRGCDPSSMWEYDPRAKVIYDDV